MGADEVRDREHLESVWNSLDELLNAYDDLLESLFNIMTDLGDKRGIITNSQARKMIDKFLQELNNNDLILRANSDKIFKIQEKLGDFIDQTYEEGDILEES